MNRSELVFCCIFYLYYDTDKNVLNVIFKTLKIDDVMFDHDLISSLDNGRCVLNMSQFRSNFKFNCDKKYRVLD